MGIFFMVIGLILLIAGGTGLFFTYTNFAFDSLDWILGTLTYGTFAVIGIAIIVFLAILPPGET